MVSRARNEVKLTPLEPVLALQNVIHHLVIFTRIRAIDQVYFEAAESGAAQD
jgi:hypothetical protein